jgi:DNA-binding XRE family transcriptional regulator
MSTNPDPAAYAEEFRHLKEVRAQALEHYRLTQQFAAERRDLIRALIGKGFSQADIARELGVTRQAIQKMLALLSRSLCSPRSPPGAGARWLAGIGQ